MIAHLRHRAGVRPAVTKRITSDCPPINVVEGNSFTDIHIFKATVVLQANVNITKIRQLQTTNLDQSSKNVYL